MNRSWSLTLALIVALAALCAQAFAQSLQSGDVSGTITDPSGAVIPGVTVTLRSLDTGVTETATTGPAGAYRFSLLKPGHYMVSATQSGFQKAQREVTVELGQIAVADLSLTVGSATQTVEVTAAAPLINTEPSMNTAFTQVEVQELPSPGGDITNIAETVSGVVMNNTGGYGNFTINGLPATSNLFTVNGENDMDPYFNINNSGASNLTIGSNELQEATVIANPYSGEYGQLAGAQVTYVTRSGTNQFHGNALYWWNGRDLNSNDFFFNENGVSRPFSNDNQYAASLGGPIRNNSNFFFVDTEGLRFVLPNAFTTTIPTQQFVAAALANIQNREPNEVPMYTKMFNLWENAPGASSAQPIPNANIANDACDNLNLPGFNPATENCAAQFRSSANALGTEWILAFRVDQKLGNNDNIYFRYKLDHGLQPTSINAISPAFNALSNQPAYDMQLNEVHIFGPRSTNSVTATFSHYVAQFAQNHAEAVAAFPYDVITSGSVPFSGFNPLIDFPQGRNISQYQFIDDFTHIVGSHNLKFGVNFRRYDVSDHNFFWNSPAVYFGYGASGLQEFVDGYAYQYRMSLNLASDVPIAMWGIGFYAQDEWKVTPHLTLTAGLRFERNSNPVCQFHCFANFKGPWTSLASVTSSDPGSVPYSADIAYNLHQAYPGVNAILPSPRVGFSWSPFGNNKTVVSGGFGIFYDNPAAGVVDDLLADPPVSVAIRVRPKGGTLPFDPAGGAATWAASAAAFNVQDTYGQIASALHALGAVFNAPAFTAIEGTFQAPMWKEWNIQIQRQVTNSIVVLANYVGNSGTRIPYTNSWPIAYDPYELYPGIPGIKEDTPLVPNYNQVTLLQSGALSNYNALNLTARKTFSNWFSALFNYSWAHNLDEVSNGGIFTYGDSLLGQINPLSLRTDNYGNSDYDVRQVFNAAWVVHPAPRFNNHALNAFFNGWEWSGKWFWRTGLPFSVTDSNVAGYLNNGGGTQMAYPIASGVQSGGCGIANAENVNTTGTPCINANSFLNTGAASFTNFTAWSPQTRNQFRGPHYFDIDMALYKTFKFGEGKNLGIGAQAFNVFNHPNFGNPDSGLGDPTFGLLTGMAGTPTSPYGSFLGFDSSVRVVQLSAKLQF